MAILIPASVVLDLTCEVEEPVPAFPRWRSHEGPCGTTWLDDVINDTRQLTWAMVVWKTRLTLNCYCCCICFMKTENTWTG